MADQTDDVPVEPPEDEAIGDEAVDDAEDEDEGNEGETGIDEFVATPDRKVGLGGDVSLDLKAAHVVAAHLGGVVVLVAGQRKSGKTTLLTELYARFLNGPFAGLDFAGSETLDAFDERHFSGREASGNDRGSMGHTEDADTRFLHLRLAEGDVQRGLLLTDLKGELFTDLCNGARVETVVPIARRADRTVIVLDGEHVADLGRRQIEERDAMMLLGALSEESGIRRDLPVLIMLTKADLLEDDPKKLDWFAGCARRLREFAKSRHLVSVESIVVAAQPADGSDPQGLEDVMRWMWVSSPLAATVHPVRRHVTGRVFLSSREMRPR